MNKEEFARIAMALRTYYPRENLMPNEKAVALWFEQLKDLDYKTAEAAIQKWVATNKWSPSIADIREQAAEIVNGALPDWGEAWGHVYKAMQNYGFYRADEALASFDDLTLQVVKQLGWTNLCMSENIATDRANFRMMYESLAQRRKKETQIPARIKALIESMSMKGLEG